MGEGGNVLTAAAPVPGITVVCSCHEEEDDPLQLSRAGSCLSSSITDSPSISYFADLLDSRTGRNVMHEIFIFNDFNDF